MEALESWKQFTVYSKGSRNKTFPVQVLDGFLPEFYNRCKWAIYQWHFLFEPSCLVRFQSVDDQLILNIAEQIAEEFGLVFEEGDIATIAVSPSGDAGVDYHGESKYYGEDLWKANAKFLDAMTGVSLELSKTVGEDFLKMARKHVHLFCNMLGMNASEEAAFHAYCSNRAMELYEKYRTQ